MSSIMRTFLRYGDEIISAENSFIGFRILAKSTAIRTNWIPMDNFHHTDGWWHDVQDRAEDHKNLTFKSVTIKEIK
jgi:histidinol-phosphate/aromatic aminotransferase/cobyric acid decarboxylase-like protein